MNNKQALKHLAHIATNCLEGVQKGNIVAHKQIEALNTGIQAILKQTPYKPIKMQSKEPEYMCECGYKLTIPDITYGMIPDKYCRECGQRLDWSDVIE